jgi:histidinol-phosphate aminotransferase
MAAAVRADTSIVYVCNPNNPTGTHVGGADLFGFIDGLPSDVLVVVDEAYVEYATAPDYASALPLAMERDNVVVARTFSKAYGLAGLRVGYLVGSPEVFDWTRKVQLPFTVSTVAQAAAREALRHSDRLAERIHLNAAGLKLFTEELTARGIRHADSQTNFVYLRCGGDAEAFQERMLRQGVIVRPQADGWSRVSIGTEAENRAFFRALDVLEDETA